MGVYRKYWLGYYILVNCDDDFKFSQLATASDLLISKLNFPGLPAWLFSFLQN
jgi:hypothetical protein